MEIVGNMDPFTLLVMVCIILIAFVTVCALIVDAISKITRTIVLGITRVQVAKHRSRRPNGDPGRSNYHLEYGIYGSLSEKRQIRADWR